MSVDPEKVKTYMSLKSKEYEMLRVQADELQLPDDVQKLINDWREGAESLPDELPQKNYILKMLSAAQGAFERHDIRNVRFWLLKARNNFENAKHDKWLIGVQRQYGKDADHRRQQVKEDREPRWQMWQQEADKIRAESRVQLSKSDIARKIKKRLSVEESERTIRHRIT